ncbi:hypothetical protein SAMN02745146_3332 [Hymenobacter daecheongensis DSM 21074]|uniref:Uncharacterized protein n=1 Tax=Hymenobacter daecheongensis DSM 21074 TaxID=1121955 RepID=A0A1M6JZI1_9BACT|nr:hypothetical protein [Hymenobacter daecheongensis]SHJ52058.1 hypothetical protein SAMN02745146_3332 [Hymenobacter daecheongensis DSM 21074]
MKNALLALTLFAFIGTAAAHDGKDEKGKKSKKEACPTAMKASCSKEGTTAATPSCCMKKGAKTAAVKSAETMPAAPAFKSL